MSSSSPQKWMSFLDEGIILDDPHHPHPLYWCGVNEQADLRIDITKASTGPHLDGLLCCESDNADNGCTRHGVSDQENASSKKRSRDESNGRLSSKACREKMRRDRLNERFLELSTLLEPGKTPKADKSVVLSDALRVLKQLKTEAHQLNHSNETLRENIKELKTEKSELRDEKQRLRVEKERLEQQMKLIMLPSGYFPHPAAMHAAMAAFAQTQPVNGKILSAPNHLGTGMGMWQWMPPAALDTSHDHMLRPPVA